eukprot:911188-Pyramimonas_sp.AAC.1
MHFGVFGKFFAVQIPILQCGLRWVGIWYCDKNLPLKGIAYALPIRADKIDGAHMEVAMKGPSSCSSLVAEYAQSRGLPFFGTPSLQRVRIPRTPPRNAAPRTPRSGREP